MKRPLARVFVSLLAVYFACSVACSSSDEPDGAPRTVDAAENGDSTLPPADTGTGDTSLAPADARLDASDGTVADTSLTLDGDTDAALGDATSDESIPPPCPTPPTPTANTTLPGATRIPNPTLRSLSIEWDITGDANNDGVVSVRYRAGAATWRNAMPLRRIPAGSNLGFSWPNRHSGSIFDLEPDTDYEIELSLRDPDGGCELRTLTARTRPVPASMAGAPVRAATPSTFASISSSANPGDIIELAAGTYSGFTFGRDGELARPIVIRGAAGATVNGNIDMFGRQYVHIVGLTVNGRIRFNGGRGIAIMRNTVTTTGDGIVSFLRSEDCYVADNVVTGATLWETAALGVSGNNVGEGILVTGPGHVIEHNRVSGFRDGISFLEDAEAVDQWSIDVVENDIERCADDGVEADFCFHNCRVMRNRLTNVFVALSSQPGLGGPTYFMRNAMYNVILSAFKLQRASVGDVILHNTVVKNGDGFGIYTSEPIARGYTRNNLFIGGPGGTYNSYSSGSGAVLQIATADATCDFDYDGYGSTLGTFTGRLGAARFTNLAELRSLTTERNARELDLTAFAATVAYPSSPFPALAKVDLRPSAAGAAIDVGLPLFNVNDDFAGAAPDLGAYELGVALPTYGPR
jgi:hypothetical protein